ncbi:hypothetical protein [uncultured Desulfovibrio sp.]|uniref:hypothetical protein n=1 Tax=uncultured Desulfovibrio sp. TaxID=167968 RepID=UPI0003B53EDE|nr:hypothetical protein [uncultured Desulfovibrio sp.]
MKHPLASGEIPQAGGTGDNYFFCMDCSAFAPEQGIFVCLQRISRLPFVRTATPGIQLLQTLRQSAASSLITSSAFPINELAGIATAFHIQNLFF